ncbi:hypothetical protein PV325_009294 [Microctonus aethiopoides]|nr:hypothetical protein PV325_009294 [Microctonus aethiopoides]
MSEWTNNGSGGATSNSRSTSRNRRHPRDHGKAMQKQKSKNKLKGRDLNRKGAEKEGTDMDAFVNQSLQPLKPEDKAQEHEKESVSETTVNAGNVDRHQQSEKKIESLPQRMESIESTKVDSESKSEIKPDVESDQKLVNRSPLHQQSEQILSKSNESINKQMPKNDQSSLVDEKTMTVENYNEKCQDLPLTIEDSNRCAQLSDKKTNDVVDHVKISDAINVETVVAQKNEENVKVSAGHQESNVSNLSPDEEAALIVDKQKENEQINQADSIPKATAAPKYQYNAHQWSPRNTSGKKEYDREFLMKLQDDPQSRIRPSNLPDIEVVLKDCTRQSIPRNTMDMRMYKDNRAHEQLFPLFAKPSFNAKLPPPTKKSYQGKSKATKPNVIHLSLSLREDVKLRETENAWKPARLKDEVASEDDIKTQALYKKVRSVLNKLTPQKFDTLVNQVRSLNIDTQGRLQGVIDLVFEKAIDEPGFSVAYALMCKELCHMQVASTDKTTAEEAEANYDFRKLLVTRCQMEFEKNAVDEMARITKVREIEQCTDTDKKKELQALLDEADRQLRMRSVGNIRFIGELYKQEMLTANIMHKCIKHLLHDIDEENLECLCKLLTTIGKIFEGKQHDLSGYFTTLSELTNRKNHKKISSRVRFMIQDVIDLRNSRWVPRRDESNPKTMDQILKEAESERIEIQLNNTPRKDDRNSLRKHNRGIGSGMNDGWSPPVGKTRALSIETSKLSTKPPSMDDLKLGNKNLFVWKTAPPVAEKPNTIGTLNKFALLGEASDQDKRPSLPLSGSRSTGSREYRSDYKYAWGRGSRNGSSHQMSSSSSNREGSLLENSRSQSNPMPMQPMKRTPAPAPIANISSNIQTTKPPKTEDELIAIFKGIVDKSNLMPNTESFIEAALETIHDHFDNSSFPKFVQNIMNTVLERSAQVRHRISVLLSHLINNKMISLSLVQDEYEKVIEIADDLVIDIPKCWTYFAEILSDMVVLGAHPLSELKRTLAVLRNNGNTGKLLGELLTKLAKDQGPKWVTDKWNQSGIEWSDIIDKDRESVEDMIKKYNLEFMINGCSNSEKFSSGENLSFDKIHDHLLKLMRDSNFDNITSWIAANVGDRSKQPQFIRILITAILEVSIESYNDSWRLNSESLNNLLPLVTRYVDTDDQLELQCLYGIQAYMHKLMHPQGVLSNVIVALCEGGIISDDAFLAWQKSTDPAEVQGHAISVKALTSFFVNLQEHDSGEEA